MGNKVSRKHSHQESHTHQSQSESTHRKLVPERSPTEKYAFIPDQYETLDEVLLHSLQPYLWTPTKVWYLTVELGNKVSELF
jgi:hypothetical protein